MRALDPITEALGRLVSALEMIGLEAFVPRPGGRAGRPRTGAPRPSPRRRASVLKETSGGDNYRPRVNYPSSQPRSETQSMKEGPWNFSISRPFS
jgi:hypothetical protein